MRAHTITTISRRRRSARRRLVLALALGVCALAIPASASADPSAPGYSRANAIAAGLEESHQPTSGSGGSPGAGSSIALRRDGSKAEPFVSGPGIGYSSVNAISGTPASEPTLVTGSPAGTSDGFDWVSALVGAGAAMALAALGGAALLTVRRRPPVPPPAPTS
jgi:hypothetical protein